MSNSKYNNLADLTAGTFNWKIKVRIIRNWRGVSSSGDGWKGINLLLLDDKNFRMHAFVPGKVFEENETKLEDGNICCISNFNIKDYEITEKFRCVNYDKQIILTNYTEIKKVDHDDGLIQRNMFDFYDLSQLENIADKNIFLTDVVGIIEKDTPIGDLTNRFGKKQKQVKFNIVDGRSSVNVCFWDAMAENFTEAIQEVQEYPTIIIIASAKVTSWQPPRQNTKQYELANVTATKFYINYEDHSVGVLRKMFEKGLFAKYNFVNHVKEKNEKLSVAAIKNLPIEYAEREVICKVKIKSVIDSGNWFTYNCTSCYKEIDIKDGSLKCYRCSNRNVPEPDLRWAIPVVAEDETGTIDIVLLDREIRTIFNLTVMDFDDEVLREKKVPPIIKSLEKQIFMMKLQIKQSNILGQLNSYNATGIYSCGSDTTNVEDGTMTPQSTIQSTFTQDSGPSCHLEDISDPTISSPVLDKRSKRKKKPTKKFDMI